ncbi:phosphoribosyltransferase [Candidatus Wolfebacteria bacterium]|nr:phosphoribosyltransferase [Candidatus Wolfebacteria bacterium]
MEAIYVNNHFVYTKGGHGQGYVNKDALYIDPDKLSLLCKEIAWRARDLGVQVVCGPTVGGVLVANRVAEWLRKFTGDYSIIAVFADQEGDGRVLKRGYAKKVAGKKVLGVEDIINTGGSAADAIKAVQKAEGEVVACFALCNRATDKKAAAELIGVPVYSLIVMDMDNYLADECPYCKENRPINQELGHGKEFLTELAEKDREKASLLGYGAV